MTDDRLIILPMFLSLMGTVWFSFYWGDRCLDYSSWYDFPVWLTVVCLVCAVAYGVYEAVKQRMKKG